MNKKNEEKLSKFMSKILRHSPESFGIQLSEDGSCNIKELLNSIIKNDYWSTITIENIYQVVKNCPKQRYTIEDNRIKANYGHSSLKIDYKEKTPPDILYHGTNTRAISSILNEGIKPMNRKYIHLSEGTDFATLAGQRRGELVIVKIDSKKACNDGVKFFYAGNEVWLSEYISEKYILMEES